MDGTWDAIGVGGGHNGLVAAAYLAKAGQRVLVVERRPIVGGACITEEVFPGVKFSRLAYSAGLLRPEIIRDLELARFGYEAHPFDPQFFLPFPNGDSLLLWSDAKRNEKELTRFSRKDAAAYPKYVAFWTEVMELIEATVLEPHRHCRIYSACSRVPRPRNSPVGSSCRAPRTSSTNSLSP